jgi:hypothetical protein
VGLFLIGDDMKRTLSVDMADVSEAAVEAALCYLLESAWDMMDDGVSETEVLLALGQAAAIVADKIDAGGHVH